MQALETHGNGSPVGPPCRQAGSHLGTWAHEWKRIIGGSSCHQAAAYLTHLIFLSCIWLQQFVTNLANLLSNFGTSFISYVGEEQRSRSCP